MTGKIKLKNKDEHIKKARNIGVPQAGSRAIPDGEITRGETRIELTGGAEAAQGDNALKLSRQVAIHIARMLDDNNCSDIKVLELADISPVARHFVIATGTSSQQIRASAYDVIAWGKSESLDVFGRAGFQQGRWVVVDLVDVVVHIFDSEYRKFYDLELLWGDSPNVDWQTGRGPKPYHQPEEI